MIDLAKDIRRKIYSIVIQRGPKVIPLVARTSRGRGAQHLRRIRRCARIRRESGAYVKQMLRAKFRYDVRHVARVSYKCCAHLPRENRATRYVTFGPLCSCKLHGCRTCSLKARNKFRINRNWDGEKTNDQLSDQTSLILGVKIRKPSLVVITFADVYVRCAESAGPTALKVRRWHWHWCICDSPASIGLPHSGGIKIILFRLAWEFDWTHVNDQHTKFKLIK
jgi:hypothetical protein